MRGDQQVKQQEMEQYSAEEEVTKESQEVVDKKEDPNSGEVVPSEFGYLQRNEFTSEIYKIEVRNLGYFGIGVCTTNLA